MNKRSRSAQKTLSPEVELIMTKKHWTIRYHQSIWNELILVLLGFLSVGLLIFELSTTLPHETRTAFRLIDKFIACLFLFDFIAGLYASNHKKSYLKQNWYLAVAAVPFSEGIFQSLRALRILRLIPLLRLVARLQHIHWVTTQTAENIYRYMYTTIVVIVVILTGAVAFYDVEAAHHPGVNSFFDALWWSTVTTTTVGYGDIYPMTWQGRVVAMFLMFFGIGIVGTVAGTVGGSIVNRKNER